MTDAQLPVGPVDERDERDDPPSPLDKFIELQMKAEEYLVKEDLLETLAILDDENLRIDAVISALATFAQSQLPPEPVIPAPVPVSDPIPAQAPDPETLAFGDQKERARGRLERSGR